MLKILVSTENREIEGKNEIDVVEKMRGLSIFTQDETIEEYMKNTASRTETMFGFTIRYDNAVSFLRDLAHYDLIVFKS